MVRVFRVGQSAVCHLLAKNEMPAQEFWRFHKKGTATSWHAQVCGAPQSCSVVGKA